MNLLVRFSICAILVMATGCATYGPLNTSHLTSVERSAGAEQKAGPSKISTTVVDAKNTTENYEDDLLQIQWNLQALGFDFVLTNKSDQSITIPWDEAAYISPDGESMPVMHKGVRIIEADKSQPPSVLARHTKLDDLILPKAHVFWDSYFGHWTYAPLLPHGEEAWTGKTMQLLLPVMIDGAKYEYIFVFTIGEGQPKKAK